MYRVEYWDILIFWGLAPFLSSFDLFAPLPNSGEHRHNILREINIIASHNAYHTGEFGVLRQVMGLWSSA